MQPSSTSRLRERRQQLQLRSGIRADAPRASFVRDHAQFSFSPPEGAAAVSAPPVQAPGAGYGAPFRFVSDAFAQPVSAYGARARAPTGSGVRLPAPPVLETGQRRAATALPLGSATEIPTRPPAGPSMASPEISPARSPFSGRGCGFTVPDPMMPIEECSERIERLLQRVQQRHREYAAQQTSAAPRTPVRLGERAVAAAAVSRPSAGSTVSTASLHSASSIRSDAGACAIASGRAAGDAMLYSPRRRAATMGPAMDKNRDSSERVSMGRAASPAHKTPIEEMRAKIERVRARRAARLKEEMAGRSPPAGSLETAGGERPGALVRMHSEISGTTYYASDEEAEDFFEDKENLALFREVQMPVRDIDWDKRVFYHHVARTDDEFRKAAEDVEIADCRESCFTELVGRKAAARILSGRRTETRPGPAAAAANGRRQAAGLGLPGSAVLLNEDEVDAISAWIDEDSDGSSDEGDRSFDWSRHGFGYMEFRRRSRASLASSSILSPGGNAERQPASPPRQDESQEPSVSLMGAAKSGLAWSITSSTARAATENFNQAVAAAAGVPRASDERFCALEDAMLSVDDEDDDWQLLSSDELGGAPGDAAEAEAQAAAHLVALRRENDDLQRSVERTRRAVEALTRVVFGTR